jgi:hypothetical protein
MEGSFQAAGSVRGSPMLFSDEDGLDLLPYLRRIAARPAASLYLLYSIG